MASISKSMTVPAKPKPAAGGKAPTTREYLSTASPSASLVLRRADDEDGALYLDARLMGIRSGAVRDFLAARAANAANASVDDDAKSEDSYADVSVPVAPLATTVPELSLSLNEGHWQEVVDAVVWLYQSVKPESVEVKVTAKNAIGLLSAAETLRCDTLRDKCEAVLNDWFDGTTGRLAANDWDGDEEVKTVASLGNVICMSHKFDLKGLWTKLKEWLGKSKDSAKKKKVSCCGHKTCCGGSNYNRTTCRSCSGSLFNEPFQEFAFKRLMADDKNFTSALPVQAQLELAVMLI